MASWFIIKLSHGKWNVFTKAMFKYIFVNKMLTERTLESAVFNNGSFIFKKHL